VLTSRSNQNIEDKEDFATWGDIITDLGHLTADIFQTLLDSRNETGGRVARFFWYNIPKLGKHIPKYYSIIYQMATKYTKWL
jgi:hypothetical protein